MRENERLGKDRAAVLRLLERSGQSVAEFCREQGLPYGVVLRWRREARKRTREAVRWVELESEANRAHPAAKAEGGSAVGRVVAEVSLGGGVTIRIYRQEGGAC
jgi:transposase-like protein